jgi:hypothetical protein
VIKLDAKLIIKSCFWSGLFGGDAAESYYRFLVLEVGGILDTFDAKVPNADVIGDLMIWTL